jgi:CheY-like chemotaxis protein
LARKILLADDSVTAQNMGRKILADAGYDVSTVNNGSAALKRIAELKPDLIVLDVYMPGYSGLEVCQRLKDSAETAHIPVLLTVGKLEPFKPEEARRVRADAHIVKPFEASELLTAITRLEDRMVPQSDGSRFSTSVSGLERFGGDGSGRKTESEPETDTGWKSRLRFPSKKKKEEKEEADQEDIAAAANYRDFRKGKGRNGPAITVKAPAPPGQEPGLVPDIPRDITPEELDVLSALAAKLDGPVPEAENLATLAEKPANSPDAKASAVEVPSSQGRSSEGRSSEVPASASEIQSAEAAAAKTAAAKAELEIPAESNAKKEEPTEARVPVAGEPVVAAAIISAAPVTEETLTESSATAVEVKDVDVKSADVKSEVFIPVENLEPTTDVALVPSSPTAGETQQLDSKNADLTNQESADPGKKIQEMQAVETPGAVAPVVNTALLDQPPAPIDKTDEPIFASAALPEPALPEPTAAQQKIEIETLPTVEQKTVAESKQESKAEELKSEEAAAPAQFAAQLPAPVHADEPSPSDAELAEALRLLTPTANTDSTIIPSHGTLVAAGQMLAEEAARNAAEGRCWIAEAVALSPEEAALSLEAEMFRTYASTPASIGEVAAESTLGSELRSVKITGVSAIAAAVENRLAEAGLGENPPSAAENGPKFSSENVGQQTAVATESAETILVSHAAAPQTMPQTIEAQNIVVVGEQKESPVKSEDAAAKEVDVATFADAVGGAHTETKPVMETDSSPSTTTSETVSLTEENQDQSSDSGGDESMGKDAKGKSNWHQIRTTPANSAASANSVEAAKAEAAEAAPKAMAAAASADGSGSVTDASTIASIVDSVMADLRPKIVEEIAKKLAGK